MKLKRTSLLVMSTVLIVLGLLVDGHAPCRAVAQPQTPPAGARVERIAVVPFLKGRPGADGGEILNCPICELYFSKERISSDADQILTRYVQDVLENRYGARVVPLEETMEVYEPIPKDETEDTPRTLARRLGEALGTNVIVTGTVWRFRDRVPGAAEGDRGASVAFNVYLIDVASGRMLWKAKFDETQRPLSEDISGARAFLKRGAKWLSAKELARYGVKEIFKKFPL